MICDEVESRGQEHQSRIKALDAIHPQYNGKTPKDWLPIVEKRERPHDPRYLLSGYLMLVYHFYPGAQQLKTSGKYL